MRKQWKLREPDREDKMRQADKKRGAALGQGTEPGAPCLLLLDIFMTAYRTTNSVHRL